MPSTRGSARSATMVGFLDNLFGGLSADTIICEPLSGRPVTLFLIDAFALAGDAIGDISAESRPVRCFAKFGFLYQKYIPWNVRNLKSLPNRHKVYETYPK